MPDFRALWAEALSFDDFVAASREYGELWSGVHRLARLPDWAADAAAAAPRRRFLVLAEDWCNDGFSTVPVLARWAGLSAALELRILRRDEHPELMDRYLTGGTRSIPIVMVSSKGLETDRVWGLRQGAVDYMVKPVTPELLVQKAQATLAV